MADASTSSLLYSSVRNTIRDGDILLFKGRGLLSALIRFFSGSEYSHAGVVAWWERRLMVMEAAGKGVWAVPLSWRLATYPGKVHLWTPNEERLRQEHINLDRSRVTEAAKVELGKEYATWLLVRGARRLALSLKGGTDPWRPPEKFVCSQFVSRVYRAGNLDLHDGDPDQFTTPGHISQSPYLRMLGLLYTDKKGNAARYEDDADDGVEHNVEHEVDEAPAASARSGG